METYLRDEEGNFIHPNAVRYFLYQALELMKAEGSGRENDKKKNLLMECMQFLTIRRRMMKLKL